MATLSLVFGVVLIAGAATGAWGDPPRRPAAGAAPVAGAAPGLPADPAGTALSEQQAEHLLGANGDRWGAYYSAQEYAAFSQGLDGRYLGVGLSVGRGQDGVTAVSQVAPAGPAATAGIEAGDRLLRIDQDQADHLPVTEVVARLRGRDGERGVGSKSPSPCGAVPARSENCGCGEPCWTAGRSPPSSWRRACCGSPCGPSPAA